MIIKKYFFTVKHLKLKQIIYRIKKNFYNSKPIKNDALEIDPVFNLEITIKKRQTMKGEFIFSFLNKTRTLREKKDWNNSDWEKLWLYNLHYFDDLEAYNAKKRIDSHKKLIVKWIKENPCGQGVGWEPYPLSLRIVNWIKWHANTQSLRELELKSLSLQLRYLGKNMEYHILGNHLLANAKALIFGGCFFSGKEAEIWFKKGLKVFKQQLDEQILEDGGHFELSPMYHNIILEDLLDVINLLGSCQKKIPGLFLKKAKKMQSWSKIMRHTDGEIPFFNDSSFGVASKPESIDSYYLKLSLEEKQDDFNKTKALKESGYIKFIGENFIGIVDVGVIGPDYLPGHGHADALSFELSYKDNRVLVNSGTSTYENNNKRVYQRSSRSHNAIEINGESSSEIWGSFRVARRIKEIDFEVQREENRRTIIKGKHDGFKRMKNIGHHQREWEIEGKRIMIKDIVYGRGKHYLELFFHFHPDISLNFNDEILKIKLGKEEIGYLIINPQFEFFLEKTYYYPEFGLQVPKKTLKMEKKVSLPASFETLNIRFF